jgi:dihydrophenazinedicarboxylate synthase
VTESASPPDEPIALARRWLRTAVEDGASEPGVLALATVSAAGRPSNRIVQTIRFTDRGLVFASYTTSPKGRDIAATGWASGVLYWRETRRQVILTGRVERLSDAESDELWHARAPGLHPMSVATSQSAPLLDEAALLARARELGASGAPLPRPAAWVGYQLVPSTVEFWEDGPERLYWRMRYDREGRTWTRTRLQP